MTGRELGEVQRVEPMVDDRVVVRVAEEAQRRLELSPHRRREQQRVRVLRHVRGALVALDRAAAGIDEPGQRAQERGLPRSVAPEQREHVTLVDREIDPVQHLTAAELDAHAACRQHRGPGGRDGRVVRWA